MDPRNQERAHAENLAKLMLSLSTAGWSYVRALECTEQMDTATLARALRVIEQYLQTGVDTELQNVTGELRQLYPGLRPEVDLRGT
jgi:hypothetical protein